MIQQRVCRVSAAVVPSDTAACRSQLSPSHTAHFVYSRYILTESLDRRQNNLLSTGR